jgi:hypothetical protein
MRNSLLSVNVINLLIAAGGSFRCKAFTNSSFTIMNLEFSDLFWLKFLPQTKDNFMLDMNASSTDMEAMAIESNRSAVFIYRSAAVPIIDN